MWLWNLIITFSPHLQDFQRISGRYQETTLCPTNGVVAKRRTTSCWDDGAKGWGCVDRLLSHHTKDNSLKHHAAFIGKEIRVCWLSHWDVWIVAATLVSLASNTVVTKPISFFSWFSASSWESQISRLSYNKLNLSQWLVSRNCAGYFWVDISKRGGWTFSTFFSLLMIIKVPQV
jgi:hypothetical protein